jgi:outer membrane biosynthesis protein TonB
VIDTEGKVRVPVATVSDPQLAQSVLDAVKQWRYAPPTQDGLPVLVEVTRSMQWPSAARSY